MSYLSRRPVAPGQQDTWDTSFPNQSSIKKIEKGVPVLGQGKSRVVKTVKFFTISHLVYMKR